MRAVGVGARGELKVTADLAAPGRYGGTSGERGGRWRDKEIPLGGLMDSKEIGEIWNYLRRKVKADGELDKCLRGEER